MGINDVPNQVFNSELQEGNLAPDLNVLSLGMSDNEIATAIGNRVAQAESYWNGNLKLDETRKNVESFYLNNYYTQDDLYNFQIEYKDNRLFVAVETLVSLVTSKPAQPLVMQAYDTEASYELAQQLQKALLCKYEDLYLKGKFQMVARHLLMGYRLAVMKYRWDNSIGNLQEDGTRFGDLAIDTIRPQRVVLDAGAQYIDDVPLIAEYRSTPLENLCQDFPDKKDQIMTASGKKAGNLTNNVAYLEIHFTTYKKGKRIEAIVNKFKNVILSSTKSPFWNFSETYQDEQGRTRQANFLSKPSKPYVLFNFMNLGKYVIDDTSLMDQAIPQQKIVNKIGRQIAENAEQANTGTIWNSGMVKEADVAKLLGDPGEKVMATGDVNKAATRLPYNTLADYIPQFQTDARNSIDNLFATHGAVRGETTGSKTLGQDVMSQRGDSARINVLATAIEDGADRLYKGMTQCFKVFLDTPQLFKYSSEDGMTNFFSYGRDQIEDGVELRVKSGSVLPEDPTEKKAETLKMLPVLDPLSIAKGMNIPNPKEWAKQNLMYRLFPDQYMTEILQYSPDQQAQDPKALQDIQMISHGQQAQVDPNVTKQYLATYQAFVQSPQFQKLPPEIQQLHVAHLKAVLQAGKSAMGMGEEKPGVPAPQDNSGTPSQIPESATPVNPMTTQIQQQGGE